MIFKLRISLPLKTFFIFLIFLQIPVYVQPQKIDVPGIVINHEPAKSGKYIGSPSICILPNGDYVASHDYFGPGTTEHQCAITKVYKSSDKGKSWSGISEIEGQFWSNLFIHQNQLYIIGTYKHHGSLIIRRSTNGGVHWSDPADSLSGLILAGEYHTAPVPIIVHRGRIWRAIEYAKSNTAQWGVRYSAMVISAPEDADLLMASSWKATNFLKYDPDYLNGHFGGWLEGNVVIDPDRQVIDFLRVENSEAGKDMAAIVKISDDGSTAVFDTATGFIDFQGGARKFTIRYDKKTERYWTISNLITREFSCLPAGSVRNTLVLKSSTDLKEWIIHKVLLSHPDVKTHGFQYVDWQFDGNDIIFVSRTAFDDNFGGALNFHDANYLTFHRITNYSKLKKRNLNRRQFNIHSHY